MTAISRQYLADRGARITGIAPQTATGPAANQAGAAPYAAPADDFLPAPRPSPAPGAGSGRGPSRPEPVNITVVALPDAVAMVLRLGAVTAGVSADEFVYRAICRYAGELGLGALLDTALALDPDFVVGRGRPPARFRGGGP